MTPNDSLVRAIVAKCSAVEAHKLLTDQGFTVSLDTCRNLRSALLANGDATRLPSRFGGAAPAPYADPAATAVEGSRRLLEAVERHYARVATTRGCSIEAARLLMNYSRAQLAVMAA